MKKWPRDTTTADSYKTLTADGAGQVVFAGSKVLLGILVEEESAAAYIELTNTAGTSLGFKLKCDKAGRPPYNVKLTEGCKATVTGVAATDFRAQVFFKDIPEGEEDY